MPALFDKLMRAGEGKILKKLHRIAEQVNLVEEDFVSLTDAELREETDHFKKRLANGESLDDLLPEAFAAVREAAKRTLGQRHYDVQIMGGAALHLGNIAEMKTGEGKTLVSTLPAYLNALAGEGVHIVTVNDYLAERDSEWMGRVHRFLGLQTGVILSRMAPAERRIQYGCDITYGTNNEFGFDYLRDNMAWTRDDLVQRGHFFAIVDEVDSILIDEARTPLIISGPADQSSKWYGDFAQLVKRLRADEHYEVDEKKRTIGVLEEGVEKVEDYLGIDNLYESVNTPLIGYLNNAIRAKELFRRDRDYVVMNGEVLIVDEHTGRMLAGRRYNEGLHQAIEAKEGRGGQGREPDPGHDHPSELLPPLREARGHDRNGHDRGQRVPSDLQARGRSDPDQPADDPHGRGGPRLPDRAGQVQRGDRGPRRTPREGSAGAGRHHQRREVRAALRAAAATRSPARGPEREEPRARGFDRRAGRPQGRGHGGDEHGRARHRHHARRQPRVHGDGRAGAAWTVARRGRRGVRAGLARGSREGEEVGGR